MTIQHNEHEAMVISSTVETMRSKSKVDFNVTLSPTLLENIREFISKYPLDNGGIRVAFTREIPEGYDSKTFEDGDRVIAVGFGKNNYKDKYPWVLFVALSRKIGAKFSDFWQNHGLPASLLPEVLEKIDLAKPVQIEAFQGAGTWNKRRKSETLALHFLGQEPHAASGSFVPTLPIGYIIPAENRVMVTVPGRKLPREHTFYTFT